MNEMKLPQHWESARLGEKAELKNGINFKKEQKGQGILTVDVLNMYSDGICIDADNLYRVEHKIKERDLLRANDILFVRSSLKQEGVAWTSLFQGHEEPVTFCGFLIRARLTTREINPEFLTHYFRTESSHRFLVSKSARLAITNVSQATLSACPIPLPPLPEQRAIASVLGAIQEAKFARQKEIALERERKAALMDYLFSHGTKDEPRKQTEIGEIPESWEIVGLNKVCLKIVDCPHSTPKFVESGVLCARNVNIRSGIYVKEPASYTSEDEYQERIKRLTPQEGDILFSREAPIGEACVIPRDTRLSLGQRLMLLRVNPSMLDAYFLVQSFYVTELRSRLLSQGRGVTAKHLNVGDVKRLEIPIPSFDEQQEISEVLIAFDAKIAALEKETARLDELFHAMLEELMAGERSAVPLIDAELPN